MDHPGRFIASHKVAAAVGIGLLIGAVVLLMRRGHGGASSASGAPGPTYVYPTAGSAPAYGPGGAASSPSPTPGGSPTGTPPPTVSPAQVSALSALSRLNAQEVAGGNSNLSIVQTIQDAQIAAHAGNLSAQDQQLVQSIAAAGPGGALTHQQLMDVGNQWKQLANDLGAGTAQLQGWG